MPDLSIKIISRGKGRSAVAAAAYRAAEIINSEYNGVTHDYTRKGGVVHTEILLPEYAPREYTDRAVLWNAVEMSERNNNAQLAREIEISLPVELTREQNIALAREYAQRQFANNGMCADVCIHDKGDGNPHAHIMLTMRPFNEDGTWAAKSKKEYILDDNGERILLKSGAYKTRKICTIDWNEQAKAEEWRAAWADTVNQYLKQNNIAGHIDHRSYERQGINQIPTVHLGVAASQMEKRGIRTERGNINREIIVTNQQMGQLRARIRKVKTWLYAQPLSDPPTMVSVMSHVADGKNLNSRYQKIANLKIQAKLLIFIQENDINDFSAFADIITHLHQSQYDLANAIKKEERRISTLNQHLAQVDIFKQHKAVYTKYKSLDPKKRNTFSDKHSEEITAYEVASKYLKEHLNGYNKIPEKAWRDERDELLAARYAHVEEYYNLKDDVRNAEVLRKGAENIMREDASRAQPQRTQNMEL